MNFTTYFSSSAYTAKHSHSGTNQVMNSAGGYAWAVDSWTRLDRFLVLGTEGGTYYTGEQQLTAGKCPSCPLVSLPMGHESLRVLSRLAGGPCTKERSGALCPGYVCGPWRRSNP
ncbi:MAG: hypothetical protein R2867_25735 [Caldilineaceae bacterium]